MSISGRVVGAVYDWLMDRIDRKGAAAHRGRVAADATGDVLEIGAGTGRNLPLYRNARQVVALEPHAGMRQRAKRRAGEARVPVWLVAGDAMHLPFPSGSFDAVVASLVLCSVPAQEQVLGEVRRVLRPGGSLRFYEHVRSPDPGLARWQDRFSCLWSWMGSGCRPNRDTVAAIETAGFRLRDVNRFDFAGVPVIVRPHVLGVAERPADPVRPLGRRSKLMASA